MPATVQLTRGPMPPHGRRAAAGPAILAGLAGLLACGSAVAQSFSPYSDFQSMTPGQLATLQVKLSYQGPSDRPVRTRAFTSPSNPLDLSLFTPFRRPGFEYADDDRPPISFTASVAELDAMLDSVAVLPGVTDGDVDPGGFLSFALLATAGGTRAFEAVVDAANAAQVLARMRGALAANAAAVRVLDLLACELDLGPATPPADVTADVSVSLRGVRLVRSTGLFTGRVRVTNITASALAAPLTLVLDPDPNVRVVGEDGFTCRIYPVGAAWLELPVGAGLAPGANVELVLRFENPDLDPIRLSPRVFSGPGAR